jgi:hypothetical protein
VTGPAGMGRSPFSRWFGALPTRFGFYIMLGATILAVAGTLVTGSEPGFLLGFLIIVGSVVAALVIRRRSVYLLIPLPALLLFLAAVLTGAVKDSSIDTSKAELGVSFLQWIADVFFPICAATILVLVIAAGRWLFSRQLVAGQFRSYGGRGGAEPGPRAAPAGPRADRGRRPPGDRDRDPWGAVTPWDDRGSTGGQRATRDPGDPWGNRRPPSGRQPSDWGQPGGQQPRGGRPGDRTFPPDRPMPPDRTLPPDRPVPPDRGQRGQRNQLDGRDPRGTGNQRANPDQRDPRDPWGQRLDPEAAAVPNSGR